MDGKAKNMHLEQAPDKILDEIQQIVLQQQAEFDRYLGRCSPGTGKRKDFPGNRKKA